MLRVGPLFTRNGNSATYKGIQHRFPVSNMLNSRREGDARREDDWNVGRLVGQDCHHFGFSFLASALKRTFALVQNRLVCLIERQAQSNQHLHSFADIFQNATLFLQPCVGAPFLFSQLIRSSTPSRE